MCLVWLYFVFFFFCFFFQAEEGIRGRTVTGGSDVCSSDRVVHCPHIFVFFFKEKTAYELATDWSSDVCLPICCLNEPTPFLGSR